MSEDDPLTPWEKLQVLAVYSQLKRVITDDRPSPVKDLLLERIASAYVRKRRDE